MTLERKLEKIAALPELLPIDEEEHYARLLKLKKFKKVVSSRLNTVKGKILYKL
jgi:hypothetical protein